MRSYLHSFVLIVLRFLLNILCSIFEVSMEIWVEL